VAALKSDPQLQVELLAAEAAQQALRTAQVLLVAEPGVNGAVVFRYDDTNPDARMARLLADRAIQVAEGQEDPVASSDVLMREPGSRYIDFLVPGIPDCRYAAAQAAEAHRGHADAAALLSALLPAVETGAAAC
jgi:hypothetical protein